MKKTLIALAVLAASGASIAQVTITGAVAMGFRATTTGTVGGSTDASGLGTDTGAITFKAMEDLGGGYSITAEQNLAVGQRAASAGEDAKLSLVTPGGMFVLATAQGADYLSAGAAGVGSIGWDGKIFSTKSNRDSLSYVLPMGAFTFSASMQESANLLGLGAGTAGAEPTTNQSLAVLGATYSAGPVVANFQVLKNGSTQATGKGIGAYRASASYDLGVAKIGAGVVLGSTTNIAGASDAKTTDSLISVTVPMGQSTFGAAYATRKFDDFGAGMGVSNGTATGMSIKYAYAMSKRTTVSVDYARWNQTGAAGVTTNLNDSNQYNILLGHSF